MASDCVCFAGFSASTAEDGSTACVCDVGFEMLNGVSCNPCGIATYKAVVGNSKCLNCPFAQSITHGVQSDSEDACVCKVGFYSEQMNWTHVCNACPTSANCTDPGATLERRDTDAAPRTLALEQSLEAHREVLHTAQLQWWQQPTDEKRQRPSIA